MDPTTSMQFLTWILKISFASGNSGCCSEDNIYERYPHILEGQNMSDNQMQPLEHKIPTPPHSYQENENLS